MSYDNLVGDLKSGTIPLVQIFLDPNNPRFIGSDWKYVPDQQIALPQIQEATCGKLVREFGVEKLKMSIETNGFLPIDRVIIRELSENQYVVLEGNRRICAAKLVDSQSTAGEWVSERVLQSLKEIPCLIYTGRDSDASWIFQGLRHISGITDWSSFNKAKLLVEQVEDNGLSLTEVGKRFGLTAHGAGQWVRGYYAFKQAKERSDYIREVDERVYPYLQELFSRSSIRVREWLTWDDTQNRFLNDLNFNEFVGWFYPRNPDAGDDALGEWEKRVIKRQDDIRQLAFLMAEAPDAFEQFRHYLDLDKAYGSVVARRQEEAVKEAYDPVEAVFTSIRECTKTLENIPLKATRNKTHRERLENMLAGLEQAISEIKENL